MSFVSKEDVSSSQPVSLIQTKSFWVQLIGIVVLGLKVLGVSTGTIDVGGLADSFMNIIGGVTYLAGMYTRYVATKTVTGIIAPGPVVSSASLQPPKR